MAFYVDTIEQIKGENGPTEYGKREKKATKEAALVDFYSKLSNVANDIGEGKNHYFMDIRIVNSQGGVEKKDSVGEYKEA